MHDIYADDFTEEICSADKELIDVLPEYSVIHYIVDGEGYVNGTKIGKGYFFAVMANHHVRYFPEKTNPWTYIYVRFYGVGRVLAFSQSGFENGVYIGTFDFTDVLRSMLNVSRHFTDDINAQRHIAHLLLSLHSRKKACNTTIPQPLKHVTEIKSYIDANYNKNISVESISKKYNLSRPYIRNIFVKYLHMSPKEYMQKKRLERAAELLLITDYSISCISLAVGYPDPLQFSRYFSKKFGKSPTAYRKDLQKV